MNVAPIAGRPRGACSAAGWADWPLSGRDWNWSWLGGRSTAMRSPWAMMALWAAVGCTGISLGVSSFLPELAILSAIAAGFWWQVVRVVEG